MPRRYLDGSVTKINVTTGAVTMSDFLDDDEIRAGTPLADDELPGTFADADDATVSVGTPRKMDGTFRYERRWGTRSDGTTGFGWAIIEVRDAGSTPAPPAPLTLTYTSGSSRALTGTVTGITLDPSWNPTPGTTSQFYKIFFTHDGTPVRYLPLQADTATTFHMTMDEWVATNYAGVTLSGQLYFENRDDDTDGPLGPTVDNLIVVLP